jgi:hypothetical protein
MQTIAALSIRQPWASAILLGKDVENRSRRFRHRGPLLIHASTHMDTRAWKDRRILDLDLESDDLPLGKLIGIVNVIDCVAEHSSGWADQDCWKMILANPRPLLELVPYRGQLSIFQVPLKLLRGALPLDLDLTPAQQALAL